MKKLILVLMVLFSQMLFAQTDIIINDGDTLKIHPIGDSITRGKAGDTFRHYLKTKLKNEIRMNIDFVGQCPHAADGLAKWEDNPNLFNLLNGDIEHDGWGGLRIEQITDLTNNTRGYPSITIEQMVNDSPSDVILLMLGTNDIISKFDLDNAPARLDTIIRRIMDATSSHLIVGTIPPTPLPIANGRIETFNSAIPAIVDSYKVLGRNISFIDVNSFMDASTDVLGDSYHPNELGNSHIADGWFAAITNVVTDVEESNDNTTPKKFGLKQNYPNPFNPETKIEYSIPQNSHVSIRIYDSLAREVATLLNENKSSGNYEITFNAENLSSGIYFYKLTTAEFSETKRMLLIK